MCNLISSVNDTQVGWFKNIDGQGTFSSPIAIQEGKRTSFALAPADFDGNGTIDLVVSFFDDAFQKSIVGSS